MIELNNIPEETYQVLEKIIKSDDSPVGIDATKTHVLILHRLIELEKKLDKLINTQAPAQA